jgi:hypothetical protein
MSEHFKPDMRLEKNQFIEKYIQFLHIEHDKVLAEKYLAARYEWLHNRATWCEVCNAFTAMKKGVEA